VGSAADAQDAARRIGVLAEEYVGPEAVDDGEWDLYFGPMNLGRFHERLRRVDDARGKLARKNLKV
jgi:hypothetical protein